MKTVSIDSDGTTVVQEAAGVDEKGQPVYSTWRCRPDQADKHLATWADTSRAAGRDDKGRAVAAQPLTAGDASAIRDAAHEYRKQRDS